jgi:hypothetical protein
VLVTNSRSARSIEFAVTGRERNAHPSWSLSVTVPCALTGDPQASGQYAETENDDKLSADGDGSADGGMTPNL